MKNNILVGLLGLFNHPQNDHHSNAAFFDHDCRWRGTKKRIWTLGNLCQGLHVLLHGLKPPPGNYMERYLSSVNAYKSTFLPWLAQSLALLTLAPR